MKHWEQCSDAERIERLADTVHKLSKQMSSMDEFLVERFGYGNIPGYERLNIKAVTDFNHLPNGEPWLGRKW